MSSHAFRCPWALFLLLLSPALPALQPPDRSEAERALLAGDCKGAVDGYLASGLADRDPRTIERALEVARACRNLPAAAQAADRLFELDGENVEALRLIGLVALETWRLDVARKVYRDLLVKPDVEVDRALADLLPEIAEGGATPAAWLVFRDLVDREKASAGTLATLARIACNADDLSACRELIAAARAKGGGNEARTIRLLAAAAAAQGDDRVALAE
ncbi:MAG: hypothetical protein FJ167_03105, partial [Gammaproteobacteria bacterium]|nr:hypothetical protein [Gammaproteobacteria bacterium]